jgi:hypothetical protein
MAQTRPLRAHMIHSWDGTEWQIFVAEPDESRWPHVAFPITDGIPTLAVRTKALTGLGYVALGSGTAWEWMETAFEGDPDGTISLVATTTVAPLTDDPSDPT